MSNEQESRTPRCSVCGAGESEPCRGNCESRSATSQRPLNEDMDASRWAREFMALNYATHEINEGLMVGWFANAIMCGYDEAKRRVWTFGSNEDLLNVARELRDAFHYNPGHSDLDNEQPIHIRTTLGTWRRLNMLVAILEAKA